MMPKQGNAGAPSDLHKHIAHIPTIPKRYAISGSLQRFFNNRLAISGKNMMEVSLISQWNKEIS